MNKRVAYPMFLIGVYISFAAATRLIAYMINVENGSITSIHYVYTGFELVFALLIPYLFFIESDENPVVRKTAFLFAGAAIFNTFWTILVLNHIDFIDENWLMIIYGAIFGYIIYLGQQEDKLNGKHYRIGRSIMIAGVLSLAYILIAPSSLSRLLYSYDTFYLNTFVLVILIAESLILDDLLLERRAKKEEKRVTLKD